MDNIREKLVELLDEARAKRREICYAHTDCNSCVFGEEGENCGDKMIADHLLANGVTVQEWIPVTDDSPKNGVKVLIANEDIVRRGYRRPDGVWKYGAELHERWDKLSLFPPTHWMPLPMPPKGGKQQ